MLTLPLVPNLQLILPLLHLKSERALGALSNISHGFFRFQFKYFTQRQEHSGWSHVKKKAPLTTVHFLPPVTVIQPVNWPAFFRSFFAVITYIWFSNQKKMGHSAFEYSPQLTLRTTHARDRNKRLRHRSPSRSYSLHALSSPRASIASTVVNPSHALHPLQVTQLLPIRRCRFTCPTTACIFHSTPFNAIQLHPLL
jgi:hypothetical protein